MSEIELSKLLNGEIETINSEKIGMVSHLIGYWPKSKEVCEITSKIIDSGKSLPDKYSHCARDPFYHDKSSVPILFRELKGLYNDKDNLKAMLPFELEFKVLLSTLEYANDNEQCFLSFLENPYDEERHTLLPISVENFQF